MENIILRNGNTIPAVGLGTWQINDRQLMAEVIAGAYSSGYRLIDTAAAYSNEIAIAKALAAAELPREELFISDKVWNTNRGYDQVQEACRKSIKKLKVEYLDAFLIHWPASPKLHNDWKEINADTWRGMEQLYKDGLVKNIGVCNFKIHQLEELKKTAEIMPFINQLEVHPGYYPSDIIDYCRSEGIVVEASSPLGNGQILQNASLKEIASAHNKTVAQVCLRWGHQKGLVLIPKSTKISRLKENIDFFDFELSEDEVRTIDELPYCGGIGLDSDEVVEFG